MSRRIFLLSPARLDGVRARQLLRPEAGFDLAVRLREGAPVTLGEAMTFASGLYFRGKLAYARAFSRPPGEATPGEATPGEDAPGHDGPGQNAPGHDAPGLHGALVIVPGEGLLPADTPVRADDLARFARVPVDLRDPRYVDAFTAALTTLGRAHAGPVVLLGSLATPKYLAPLRATLPGRILVPAAFPGMGDMRRGSVLLRAAREGRELAYVNIEGLFGER